MSDATKRTTEPTEPYTSDYLVEEGQVSQRSASVVVPLVLALWPASSVVDVGCGLGSWAAEFLANGVEEVWGIDGDYVDRSLLLIPPDRFLAQDLTRSVRFDRKIELAVCLEVAEHLPESRAVGLVADLTTLSRCVLFSAAVPGQGGLHHINEQYLSYWTKLFEKRGYKGIDPIRPRILGNDSVAWWYQQNIVMYVAPNHLLLNRNFPDPGDIVHRELYESVLSALPSLGQTLLNLPGAFRRSIRHRLGL